jgi:hypothetical protein
MDFQHRHDGRPVVTLEGAYDLGYRGVVPTKIAERMTRPPTPGEQLESEDRPEKLVWYVAAAIVAVGVSLSTMYAISLDKKMPLVEREEEQDEEGQQQGPNDATPGPPARNCEGRWCREKEQLGGGPPNPLEERERGGDVCQTCQMRITEGKYIVRLEGPAGMRTNPKGQLEGLVEGFVRRPPEWEEAMRVLKATLGRENVSDRTAGNRLKALGLRYVGKTGETHGGLAQGTLQLDCICGDSKEDDQCTTICGGCGGVRWEVRAGEIPRTEDLRGMWTRGGEQSEVWGLRRDKTRGASKRTRTRAKGGCVQAASIVDNTSTRRVSGGCARTASSGTQGHYTSTRGGRRGQRATCRGRPWRSTGVCPKEPAGRRSAGRRPGQALPRETHRWEGMIGEMEAQGEKESGAASTLRTERESGKRRSLATHRRIPAMPLHGRNAGIVIVGAKEKPARKGNETREHYLSWRQ